MAESSPAWPAPARTIAFDAAWASGCPRREQALRRARAQAGPRQCRESRCVGAFRDEIAETLERFGLRAERILDDEDAMAAYLTRTDGSLVGRPYGFGVLLHVRAKVRQLTRPKDGRP